MDEGVYFAVSLNGVDLLQHTDARFFYLPHVKRVSIEPSGGPLTGGTLETVTGTDFDKSFPIGCKFGSYSDGIVYVSDQTIQCRSPPHPPGTVDFVVITNDNEISLDDVVFEYYKAPTILFADPISGPQHGGTVVRIYGSDFQSNVNYLCHFGDVHVSGQFVATDTIECSSPRIISEVDENHVDLVVSETKSNFTANTLRFAYVPAPSLMRLSPPSSFSTTAISFQYLEAILIQQMSLSVVLRCRLKQVGVNITKRSEQALYTAMGTLFVRYLHIPFLQPPCWSKHSLKYQQMGGTIRLLVFRSSMCQSLQFIRFIHRWAWSMVAPSLQCSALTFFKKVITGVHLEVQDQYHLNGYLMRRFRVPRQQLSIR